MDPVDTVQALDDARAAALCAPQREKILCACNDQNGVRRSARIVRHFHAAPHQAGFKLHPKRCHPADARHVGDNANARHGIIIS
jgi:hypothetical protein